MTTREDVLAALEGCEAVSYPSLLDRLRDRGVEPRGMVPVLDSMRFVGLIEMVDRKDKRWLGYGDDRGPLYIRCSSAFRGG